MPEKYELIDMEMDGDKYQVAFVRDGCAVVSMLAYHTGRNLMDRNAPAKIEVESEILKGMLQTRIELDLLTKGEAGGRDS